MLISSLYRCWFFYLLTELAVSPIFGCSCIGKWAYFTKCWTISLNLKTFFVVSLKKSEAVWYLRFRVWCLLQHVAALQLNTYCEFFFLICLFIWGSVCLLSSSSSSQCTSRNLFAHVISQCEWKLLKAVVSSFLYLCVCVRLQFTIVHLLPWIQRQLE